MSVRFGISALLPEQLSQLPAKLPQVLSAVEFPGCMLDTTAGIQKLTQLRKNNVLLWGREFISPEIAALIPSENCKLRAELESHFQKRCVQAAELGVKHFSVAFDLFQAVADGRYREQLSRFLRRCAGVIHPLDQTLLTVCRIPGGGTFDRWEELLKFRRDLLCPGIGLLLEFHPHEPGAPEIINKALQVFRLHDTCRRICYDSGVGNTLTPAALKRCSETKAIGLEQDMVIFLNSGNGKIDSGKVAEFEMLVKSFSPETEGTNEP